jgi:hypothetical protein
MMTANKAVDACSASSNNLASLPISTFPQANPMPSLLVSPPQLNPILPQVPPSNQPSYPSDPSHVVPFQQQAPAGFTSGYGVHPNVLLASQAQNAYLQFQSQSQNAYHQNQQSQNAYYMYMNTLNNFRIN